MAGGASGNQNGSAKSEYCPPNSPSGGILKPSAPANCGAKGTTAAKTTTTTTTTTTKTTGPKKK
jgi:hypothetical protein